MLIFASGTRIQGQGFMYHTALLRIRSFTMPISFPPFRLTRPSSCAIVALQTCMSFPITNSYRKAHIERFRLRCPSR